MRVRGIQRNWRQW
nr:truncated envelope glycoprotein [Human immunodeficiency virus 1]